MTSCWHEGARVILTRHPITVSRKLLYTLQAVEMPDGWVGVNTMNPNRAVAGAILAGKVKSLRGYRFLQTEVRKPQQKAALIFVLLTDFLRLRRGICC